MPLTKAREMDRATLPDGAVDAFGQSCIEHIGDAKSTLSRRLR